MLTEKASVAHTESTSQVPKLMLSADWDRGSSKHVQVENSDLQSQSASMKEDSMVDKVETVELPS